MKLLQQYRFASFMLVLVAIIAFSIASVDFALLFVAAILAMLSWYVTEGPRGKTLPTWISNTLVLAALGWAVVDFLSQTELAATTGVLGRFLLWLLVIKLFSSRGRNEDRQRFALATMIMIAGCLDSVQFAFGVLVFMYAGIAVWTAMLWRLHLGAESARASRRAEPGFSPPLEIAFGRRATPQFRGVVLGALLLVFAASVGVFLVFPRMPSFNQLQMPRGVRSVSGFSDEIRLGSNDRISESRRELFTVRWLGPDGTPVAQQRPLLLRGAVLERYDAIGERWLPARRTDAIRTFRTAPGSGMTPLGLSGALPRGATNTAEIEMRSLASNVLFSLYAPVAVSTNDARMVAFEPSTLLLRDASSNRGASSWSYSMRVQQQPSADTLVDIGVEPPSPARLVSISIPGIDVVARDVLASARGVGNFPPEPAADASEAEVYLYRREVARGIADWMKRAFSYTTDLSANVRVPNEDPILSFLARYRRGHCEYFASGLCSVLRALGIESRIVTGYIAFEYDQGAGHYIVRESNAHAWVEVRTGSAAWTAVDATPEDSLLQLQEANRSFADRFRWLYGTLEFVWNARVVGYDGSAQAAFAERVETGWRESIGQWLDGVRMRMREVAAVLGLGGARRIWFAVIAIGLTTAAVAALIVAARRHRMQQTLRVEGLPRARRRELVRQGSFYAIALAELSRAGLPKPESATPLAHAEALRASHAEVASAFEAIAREFYRIRFGGAHTPSNGGDPPEALLFALRRALSQNRGSRSAD
jgi:protein-glutamine gamma-glutamyltransferase